MADRYFDPDRWRYTEEERYRDEYRRPRWAERDWERSGGGERAWGRIGDRGWSERDYDRGEREYGRARRAPGRGDERGFLDRASDELRSWFGDEEAQRRRMRDEREDRGSDRGWLGDRDRGWGERDRGWGGDRDRSWWNDSVRRVSDRDEDIPRQWGYIDRNEWGGEWPRGRDADRFGRGYQSPSGWQSQFGSATSGTSYYGRPGMTGGQFSGRGPRGWQRSDERVREDICERMWHHADLDATDVEVRVVNAEVTLTGTVPDRDAKRLAEDVAESVSGVREVHNQLRVGGASTAQDPSQQQQQQRGFGGERRIA